MFVAAESSRWELEIYLEHHQDLCIIRLTQTLYGFISTFRVWICL